MSRHFIDAFLNSAKWNQQWSIMEWAALSANRQVTFALSGSHNTKKVNGLPVCFLHDNDIFHLEVFSLVVIFTICAIKQKTITSQDQTHTTGEPWFLQCKPEDTWTSVSVYIRRQYRTKWWHLNIGENGWIHLLNSHCTYKINQSTVPCWGTQRTYCLDFPFPGMLSCEEMAQHRSTLKACKSKVRRACLL